MTITTREEAYAYVVSKINAFNEEAGWGDANVQSDDTMFTLGFDSLDVLDIGGSIEKELSIDLDIDMHDTTSQIAYRIWHSLNSTKP